jgi:hypothetical protein
VHDAGLEVDVTGAAGLATAAVRQLGSSLTLAGVGGGMALAGAGGGGTAITLTLQPGGSAVEQALFEGIKAEVHSVGGGGTNSVQRTFGQVA